MDGKKVETTTSFLADEMDVEGQRKKWIRDEREKYLRGEGASYTTEEVRQMTTNKQQKYTKAGTSLPIRTTRV